MTDERKRRVLLKLSGEAFGRDWPGAVLEDAAAQSLAWTAVRS